MLNRITVIILLFSLISSNFSRFFVYAGFEVNSKYIAEQLCVNKDKPAMHCNGHCYLMNKLKQADEKEKKQQREEQKSRYQEALPNSALALTLRKSKFKTTYPLTLVPQTIDRHFSIFQPPKNTVLLS